MDHHVFELLERLVLGVEGIAAHLDAEQKNNEETKQFMQSMMASAVESVENSREALRLSKEARAIASSRALGGGNG